jgi:hypothetical protein
LFWAKAGKATRGNSRARADNFFSNIVEKPNWFDAVENW